VEHRLVGLHVGAGPSVRPSWSRWGTRIRGTGGPGALLGPEGSGTLCRELLGPAPWLGGSVGPWWWSNRRRPRSGVVVGGRFTGAPPVC